MPATRFDHEKLEVYQFQIRFIAWLSELFEELHAVKQKRTAETLDQLDRAGLSVLLNIAEGNGRRASQQRVRFFDDARGSATECAACLDALTAKRAATEARVAEGKAILVRVVSMLTGLLGRLEERLASEEGAQLSSRSRSTSTRRNGREHNF